MNERENGTIKWFKQSKGYGFGPGELAIVISAEYFPGLTLEDEQP